MQITHALLLASCALASPAALSLPKMCPLGHCFYRDILPPALKPQASSFCTAYLGNKRCTSTKTATKTNTVTHTNTPPGVTATATVTSTTTVGTVCSTTATTTTTEAAPPLTTSVDYVYMGNPPSSGGDSERRRRDEESGELDERGVAIPSWMTSGCAARPAAAVSGACECFIGPKWVTKTKTVSKTVTVNAATPHVTLTATAVVTTQPCTSTSTSTATVIEGGPDGSLTCGNTFTAYPTASASGSVTCASTVPQPSVNAIFRIEGNANDGTIFEGCVESGPMNITTPSGGTHLCDGTNGGRNPAPGTTPTNQIASAGSLNGFAFDGSYSNAFGDFFITTIANSPQTGSQFWGVLQNGQFTPGGGCETVTSGSDRNLWAWDAFNKNYNLQVSPDYAVAEAGSGMVAVTVSDAFSGGPVAGATLGGHLSDASGRVTISVPSEPGCYQMKATHPSGIRSNAFYLTVVDEFAQGPERT